MTKAEVYKAIDVLLKFDEIIHRIENDDDTFNAQEFDHNFQNFGTTIRRLEYWVQDEERLN